MRTLGLFKRIFSANMLRMSSRSHVSFKEVEDILRSHQHFAVVAHMRPDGDAIGSTVAMGEALKQMGKDVVMINEDGVPQNIAFMQGSEHVMTPPEEPIQADVLVSLDNGSWKRLGEQAIKAVENIPVCLNIDHHETNDCYGTMCCIMPDKSSTGEVLYDLFRFMNIPLNHVMRDAIYIAVSTDTGSFQYERTTPEVMEMAAELIRMGTNVHEINRKLYQEISWNKLVAEREVLKNIQLVANGKLSYASLSDETKKKLGIGSEDTEGLIDILRSIRGVVLAAFFEEQEDGRIRISLRSKDQDIPVNCIASEYGGGGHALAAGIRMRLPLEEAKKKVVERLKTALETPPLQSC